MFYITELQLTLSLKNLQHSVCNKMDAKEGFTHSTVNKKPHGVKLSVLIASLICTSAVALFALALATAAYVQSSHRQVQHQVIVNEIDPRLEKRALRNVEALFEKDAHHRDIRSGNNFNDICNSSISPNKTEKPTAHISANNGWRPVEIPAPPHFGNPLYSAIVSKGWDCSSAHFSSQLAHVRGGMEYNKTSGFLRLPVDGIYFVYSQLQLRSNSSQPRFLGHRTVACVPENGCRNIDEYNRATSYLESYLTSPGNHQIFLGGHFHGGLFHFSAGTHIGIIAFQYYNGLQYFANWYHSFIGAFLVDYLD